MRLSRELIEIIDTYRRLQKDPPSRPEAIRQLIGHGIDQVWQIHGKMPLS